MKNFFEDGKTIEFLAEKDVASGEAVTIGKFAVIAFDNYKQGSVGVGYAMGVYWLPKPKGICFKQGEQVFFGADGLIKAENEFHGYVWQNATNDDERVLVKLK